MQSLALLRLSGTRPGYAVRLTARIFPAWGMYALMLVFANARGEEFFNPSFLSSDPASVADLSRFEKGESAPGTYRVEVYLNEEYVATQDIVFQARRAQNSGGSDGTGLIACITRSQLEMLDVNVTSIPTLGRRRHVKSLQNCTMPTCSKLSTRKPALPRVAWNATR
ncbi:TPA: hypothetical protein QCH98_003338 [Enterobacter bugandensis]|nr:hypothetical protein [Enterobacter bugandensis]